MLTAAAATGFATSSAMAQINMVQPVVDNQGFAGNDTVVIFELDAGLGALDGFTNTEEIGGRFFLIDDAGTILLGPFNVAVTDDMGAAVDYDNGMANTGLQMDFGDVTFATALANPAVTRIRLQIGTVDNPVGDWEFAALDAMDPMADETLIKDIEAPVLTNAFLSSDGEDLFLVFSERLNNAAAANNPNHTVVAGLGGGDLQFNTSNSFDGMTPNPTGLSAPAFVGADNTTVGFTVAMMSDIALGVWLRPTHDAMDDPDHGFKDIVGNFATDGAVQITQLQELAPVSAEWIETVPANGGPVAEAVRVVWNNPLNPMMLGDVAFYDVLMLDGMASNINVPVAGVAADPDNASAVLLNVDATGADGVSTDGLDTATGEQFSFAFDSMTGTPPTDIFSQAFDGTANLNIGDGIAPAIVGAPRTFDTNGDGQIDAFALVFTEPIDISGATASAFTLTLTDGATIRPFSVFTTNLSSDRITDPTDEANEEEIDLDGGDGEFDVSGFDTSDSDPDGDRTEQGNVLVIMFDPADVIDAANTTGAPGTGDVNWATIAAVAADAGIADANGNDWGVDLGTTAVSVDGAAPVLAEVWFLTGDNVDMGNQLISEQDGVVGDQDDNNIAQLIYSEAVADGGINANAGAFRFGPGPNERFAMGDFDAIVGDGNNIVQFIDTNARGFGPGDMFRVVADNGVEDAAGNDYPGTPAGMSEDVLNRTAPYIALQRDVNGNTIHAAFLFDTSSPQNGFADRLDLFFTAPIDEDTVAADDFRVEGLTPTGVTVIGDRVQLTLPGDQFSVDTVLSVLYRGSVADPTVADGDGNAVSMVDDTFDARAVPQPDSDGEFTAVMNIAGRLTTNGTTAVPAGTKIFSFIAVPTAKAIRGRMGNMDFVLTDAGSLNAMNNFLLGIAEFVYLYDDGGTMFLRNDKSEGNFNVGQAGARSISQLTINAGNLANVTFNARGVTTSGGFSPTTTNVTNGRVQVVWDVLRSADGTASSLFNDGFGARPLSSTAVVTDEPGSGNNYLLHTTAPINAFTGLPRLNAIDWPVIIVVELPNGERYPVSSLLNAVDGMGPISFNPANRRQTAAGLGSPDRSFNINLANVGSQEIWGGWNLMAFPRRSGFATSTGVLPVLPRSVVTGDVRVGAPLTNVTPLSQFVFFNDDNGDGVWTFADDDAAPFDSIIVDVNCIQHFAFTMTSRGVQVSSAHAGRFSNTITSLVGGYAVGFFNGERSGGMPDKLGAFQFGPMITPGAIFGSGAPFPNSNVTLGWALATNVPDGETDTRTEFFANNTRADFYIQFDRTGHNLVDISTGATASGVASDSETVRLQGLFVHYTP
ncbi:MAG: hypothetical protein EA376_08535 [Phycisphaeraceae bacterium]|nr:MAG: hypothetical protein EA376_08535 [Phycisphaeraceae bacterium]